MLLYSSSSLHYPIVIKDLLYRPDDQIQKLTPIFSYEYKTTVTEGNKYGEESEVVRTFVSRFESEVEGTIKNWRIAVGSIISKEGMPLVEIEEPCRHDVQFGGLCANCGKDMTEIDYGTSAPDHLRASINMAHGNTDLRVTRDEAQRVENNAKKRLLKSEKLSLVVDLDQTIIHATVDPTVGDWMEDPTNPNFESVKDVRRFQLTEDGPGRGCWYYVKMRPGLAEFLDKISKKYELHVYTMGTRAYADQIAKIVDPERKIFGDRILSRDESGSLTAKSLQRLFPVDTKMVVIIDDRGDVWNWSKNLVKVVAYDFFKGIGDINSSFLPKRQDIVPPLELVTETKDATNGTSEEALMDMIGDLQSRSEDPDSSVEGPEASTVDQLVSMGGANDPAAIQEKVTEQDEQLAAQIADRPLLQEQLKLEQAEEIAESGENHKANTEEANDHENAELFDQLEDATHNDAIDVSRTKHHLLQDDDTELEAVKNALERIHEQFYRDYNYNVSKSVSGSGRLAELKGEKSPKKRPDYDMTLVPDVQQIMSGMKNEALRGCLIVFSGVVPIGISPRLHDYGRWAMSFGAQIYNTISKRTTHVVGQANRITGKMRKAARHKKIKIVTLDWLYEAWRTWEHPDETPFIIEVEPGRPRKLRPDGEDAPFSAFSDEDDSSESDSFDRQLQDGEDNLSLKLSIPGLPTDETEQSLGSPIDEDIDDIDWGELGDEFDDLDTESESDVPSQNGESRKRKRERDTDTESNADGNESDRSTGNRKSKRKGMGRTSSLNQVTSSRDLDDEDDENEEGQGDGDSFMGSHDSENVFGEVTKKKGRLEPNSVNPNGQDDEDENEMSDADFEAELERQLSEN